MINEIMGMNGKLDLQVICNTMAGREYEDSYLLMITNLSLPIRLRKSCIKRIRKVNAFRYFVLHRPELGGNFITNQNFRMTIMVLLETIAI